jgi:Domain of unknown function (DUF4440)
MNAIRDVILAAEQARCQAMLNNDSAVLDRLLDEELHFSHATGVIDNKRGYLAKIEAGRIVYRRIDWSEQSLFILKDAAVLSGRMKSIVAVEGNEKELDNRVLTVWRLSDAWRLLAFQSTPLINAGQPSR